jgi:hypothetical protein
MMPYENEHYVQTHLHDIEQDMENIRLADNATDGETAQPFYAASLAKLGEVLEHIGHDLHAHYAAQHAPQTNFKTA